MSDLGNSNSYDKYLKAINKIYFIYKITCIPNGLMYFGQTDDLKNRWRNHRYSAKNIETYAMYNDCQKYGIDNFKFEHIATCKSVKNADKIEDDFIVLYNTISPEFGYNRKHGGGGITEETRLKMSIATSGENNPNFGKPITEKAKKKQSKSMSGSNHPLFGKPRDLNTKIKIGNAHRGKIVSAEARKNLSIAHIITTQEQDKEIIELRKSGLSHEKICNLFCNKYFKISRKTIGNILNRYNLNV